MSRPLAGYVCTRCGAGAHPSDHMSLAELRAHLAMVHDVIVRYGAQLALALTR